MEFNCKPVPLVSGLSTIPLTYIDKETVTNVLLWYAEILPRLRGESEENYLLRIFETQKNIHDLNNVARLRIEVVNSSLNSEITEATLEG